MTDRLDRDGQGRPPASHTPSPPQSWLPANRSAFVSPVRCPPGRQATRQVFMGTLSQTYALIVPLFSEYTRTLTFEIFHQVRERFRNAFIYNHAIGMIIIMPFSFSAGAPPSSWALPLLVGSSTPRRWILGGRNLVHDTTTTMPGPSLL